MPLHRAVASEAVASGEADPAHITCFSCSRCEYPICDSGDVLLRQLRQGPSEHAFHYHLDGLLDLEETQVPCYSASEVVHTAAVVSERLLMMPLPPAAQVVALEAMAESRKNWEQQRRCMDARLREHDMAAPQASSSATSVAASPSDESDPAVGQDATAATRVPAVRRYGDVAESRVDLVCVRESVLAGGVQECTKDRSAVATLVGDAVDGGPVAAATAAAPDRAADQRGDGAAGETRSPAAVIRDPSFAHIPANVMAAATAAAADTRWSSPGNFSVCEAYIDVRRTTLSSRAPWFHNYRCVSRVQCPDCHQALGFVYHISDTKQQQQQHQQRSPTEVATPPETGSLTQGVKRPATSESESVDDRDDDGALLRAACLPRRRSAALSGATPAERAGQPPHAKKTRNERDAQAAASASTRHTWQEAMHHEQPRDGGSGPHPAGDGEERLDHGSDDDDDDDHDLTETTPDRFVGLELKRVVQRKWTLSAFHARYSKSRELRSFRELFPEAEELQSLYSRLLSLRTQAELYNSLLRRHKEQNDVQMALLSSNKDRIHTYDEKMRTMQQIIEAQRSQIAMQTRQIRNQEELVESHRRQFATQQRQMDVEQLLLVQQSKTIDSQKEQLRLLKNYFQVRRPEVLLDTRLQSSPCPTSSLHPEQPVGGGDGDVVAPRAAAAEEPARPQPVHGQQSDRTDVEEGEGEGAEEKEGGLLAEGSKRRRLSEGTAAGTRHPTGTPPAHLCGVLTSTAASCHPALVARGGRTPNEAVPLTLAPQSSPAEGSNEGNAADRQP
ncbi:hypothetical protein NESM_000389100 [Novymonas esmeraldas]|uniref:Uncharacterized protein n=1 Tax=Novymonas esmeraldas TaxID=1808958 RepID=A0AAW0EKL7_9TRYP